MNNFCYNILVDFDINLDHINQIKKDNSNMVGVNSFQVYKTNVDKTLKLFLNHYNVGISFSEIFYTPPKSKMTIHNDSHGVKTKLNWIFGADGSVMKWWKPKDGYTHNNEKNAIGNDYISYNEDDCECLWTQEVGHPSIVNVAIPHSIDNPTDDGRWCMSYVLYNNDKKENLTWNDAVLKFESILK
jgi:hypothetical protein